MCRDKEREGEREREKEREREREGERERERGESQNVFKKLNLIHIKNKDKIKRKRTHCHLPDNHRVERKAEAWARNLKSDLAGPVDSRAEVDSLPTDCSLRRCPGPGMRPRRAIAAAGPDQGSCSWGRRGRRSRRVQAAVVREDSRPADRGLNILNVDNAINKKITMMFRLKTKLQHLSQLRDHPQTERERERERERNGDCVSTPLCHKTVLSLSHNKEGIFWPIAVTHVQD